MAVAAVVQRQVDSDDGQLERQVRECLRCLVVETEQRVQNGPAYYIPELCYRPRPGKPGCQHGAACRQRSGWHWFQFDHPPTHPLLLLDDPAAAVERQSLATWLLAKVPPCRHFVNKGRCLYNDACRFEHPPKSPAELKRLAESQRAEGHQSPKGRQQGDKRKPRKSNRGYGATSAFRRFLLDTFGVEHMRAGAGVLDVAGGAGTLSYELVQLNGIPSTVCDPRRPCYARAAKVVAHRKRQERLGLGQAPALRGYDNATANDVDEGGKVPAAQDEADSLPAWGQAWFGPWLWEEGGETAAVAGVDPPQAKQEDGAGCGVVGEDHAKRLFRKDVLEFDTWDHSRADATSTTSESARATFTGTEQMIRGAEPQQEEVGLSKQERKRRARALARQRASAAAAAARRPSAQLPSAAVELEFEREPLAPDQRADSVRAGATPQTQGAAAMEAKEQVVNEQVALPRNDLARVLQDCSIVIGLHPDGATDAIVDFALHMGKPFAILPCCVYRKTFTHRRTPNGEQVRDYDDLLSYLEAKGGSESGAGSSGSGGVIRRATLDFEGRNVVLFCTDPPPAPQT